MKRALLIGLAVFVVAIGVVTAGAFALAVGYHEAYANRILPGIDAWGVPLGGLDEKKAKAALLDKEHQALASGWHFRLEDQIITLPTTVATTTSDGRRSDTPIIQFAIADAAHQAMTLGHTGSWWRDSLTHLRLRVHPIHLSVPYTLDKNAVESALENRLHLPVVQNAQLHVTILHGQATSTIEAERIGKTADVPFAVSELDSQARSLRFDEPITLPVTEIQPDLTAAQIQPLLPGVPAWLGHAPFSVRTDTRIWTVTTSTFAGWIAVTTSTDGGFTLGLDPDRVVSTLRGFADDLVQQPKNGFLTMENGVIKTFVPGVDGSDIDAPATIQAMEDGWRHNSSTIELVVKRQPSFIEGPDAERLGTIQSIGVGRSNFARSPVNRRKNIALGAQKVNGSLVAPGEEFSLLKTLGEVDGDHGWLPELVIKGDKTTPEFGGGLCQIGTTTFRAALASGLPITQRQNHSYRVAYYEPAGTDATIYEPAPDFRFKNDTGHWLLISTQIDGDNLAFTVWGTPDGRTAVQTDPKIFNIVPPPPKKIVETLDLPPGQTKCTEIAHAGADASFVYTVSYADGNVKKVTFNSHYKPWGAVCLLGVTQLTSTSTSAVDETGVNNPN